MPEISRTSLIAYGVALCVIALLGARYLKGEGQAAGGGAVPAATAPDGSLALEEPARSPGGRVTVHVAGAVHRPGVYVLRAGSRVNAAVRRAGGATRRADLAAVNLASEVEDGRQVLVPERVAGAAAGAAAAGGGAVASGGPPAQPIDLNTATLEQLDTLDGVGPATAQKIVDYREEHGGFGSVEELGQVPGIGEKRMAALRERVRV